MCLLTRSSSRSLLLRPAVQLPSKIRNIRKLRSRIMREHKFLCSLLAADKKIRPDHTKASNLPFFEEVVETVESEDEVKQVLK